MDREFLIDLFADFGPVAIRRMFSGYGISADGINFALALRAGLFFRADEMTIPDFQAEGSKPFQYSTRAKSVLVNSYWELPARLFDDSAELAQLGEGGARRRPARQGEEAAQGEEGGQEASEPAGEEGRQAREGGEESGQEQPGSQARQAKGLRINPRPSSGQPSYPWP
ncbi:DNA transformation protein [Bradyrhizobium sp. LB13.1]